MRKLASIQKIRSVEPIEDADKIELVHVLGWQCVANKGVFQPGDLCVYFEVDSFLPVDDRFEFLRKSSFKKNELLGEGFRLRTMRMRGQISQGLVMPLSEVGIQYDQNGDDLFNARDYVYRYGDQEIEMIDLVETKDINVLPMEGIDVTALLGVREWEIPEQTSSGGTIIAQANSLIHVTDETRIQSEPGLLEEFRGIPYYITTKMDGSSHSICIDTEGVFHVFGHNYEYKDDGKSAFYEFVKKQNFEALLRKYMIENGLQSITVQGELCGSGIQQNRMRLKQPDWFVFTVDENGRRVGWSEIRTVAEYINASLVPFEESGEDLCEKYPTADALLERSAENKAAYNGSQPEGIVIRPLEPVYSRILQGPLSMKVINNRYLLKNQD